MGTVALSVENYACCLSVDDFFIYFGLVLFGLTFGMLGYYVRICIESSRRTPRNNRRENKEKNDSYNATKK